MVRAAFLAIPFPHRRMDAAFDKVITDMASTRGAGFILHDRALARALCHPRESVLERTVHGSIADGTVVFAAIAVVLVLGNIVPDPYHVIKPKQLVSQRVLIVGCAVLAL